jgi:hypothetical protein
LLAPIDGAYTLSEANMVEVIEQVKPPLAIPRHYFWPERAAAPARTGDRYLVHSTPRRR